MQRDWWWYCSDWSCERIFFLSTLGFELGTSGSLVLHSTTAAWGNFWFSPLTISGIYLWCRGIEGSIVPIGPVRHFLLANTRVWSDDLWISSPAICHCTTDNLMVFTSDNFRYLTLVQRIWWWYWSDWTCDRFSFSCTGVWTGGPWISSPALYHCATATSMVFTSDNFRYVTQVQLEVVVVLFWLHLWDLFFLANTRVWSGDLWISSPALHHWAMALWISPLTISGI